MNFNLKRLALATACVGMLAIYGCGGGGGTTTTNPVGVDTPTINPTPGSTKVTPSLGQFSVGTVVNLTKPDATLLSSGTVAADGSVTLTYPASYTGPLVVTVVGGAGVTYFDEKSGSNQAFGSGSTLRAVLPAPQAQAGVTALTNAAVENLVAAGGIATASATTVNEANAKVAAVFGLADILVAPTPVSASTGNTLDLASPSDKYALVLAAFAQAAPTGTNAATFAVTLALDLKDGKLDAKNGMVVLANGMSAASMESAYQTAASSYATDDSKKVAEAAPMVVTQDVTSIRSVSNQSDVTLAKALFSELRTTLNSLSNGRSTGFLDTQVTSIKDDINANIAPELSREMKRISMLNYATTIFEDAKALTGGSTANFVVGVNPLDNTKPALIRTNGGLTSAWYGQSTYSYCWTDSSTPSAITKVSCSYAATDSADRVNNLLNMINLTVTPAAGVTQYSYTATKFYKPVNTSGSYPIFGTSVTPNIPTGSGAIGKTISNGTVVNIALNGTMPPSTNSTGVDTLVISAVRTALTGNNFRYALSGSVSAAKTADSTKVVSLSLDAGSYFDLDETPNNEMLITAKFMGTAQTAANRFNGTFDMSSFLKDLRGANPMPTSLAFTGTVSDLSTGGAGQFLTGKLEANWTNYSLYDSNLGESSNNVLKGTLTFTGTVQAPSRPLLRLVLAGTKTGHTTGTMTLNYSYGSGISITGSGVVDTANSSQNTMTLSNQAGVQMVVRQNAPAEVSKAGVRLATIENNRVNYIDGVSESF
jgi:hypothetical protein